MYEIEPKLKHKNSNLNKSFLYIQWKMEINKLASIFSMRKCIHACVVFSLWCFSFNPSHFFLFNFFSICFLDKDTAIQMSKRKQKQQQGIKLRKRIN